MKKNEDFYNFTIFCLTFSRKAPIIPLSTNKQHMTMTTEYNPVALANSFHALYDAKIDLAHELHNMYGYKEDEELEKLLDTLELTIRALKRKGCKALNPAIANA